MQIRLICILKRDFSRKLHCPFLYSCSLYFSHWHKSGHCFFVFVLHFLCGCLGITHWANRLLFSCASLLTPSSPTPSLSLTSCCSSLALFFHFHPSNIWCFYPHAAATFFYPSFSGNCTQTSELPWFAYLPIPTTWLLLFLWLHKFSLCFFYPRPCPSPLTMHLPCSSPLLKPQRAPTPMCSHGYLPHYSGLCFPLLTPVLPCLVYQAALKLAKSVGWKRLLCAFFGEKNLFGGGVLAIRMQTEFNSGSPSTLFSSYVLDVGNKTLKPSSAGTLEIQAKSEKCVCPNTRSLCRHSTDPQRDVSSEDFLYPCSHPIIMLTNSSKSAQ